MVNLALLFLSLLSFHNMCQYQVGVEESIRQHAQKQQKQLQHKQLTAVHPSEQRLD